MFPTITGVIVNNNTTPLEDIVSFGLSVHIDTDVNDRRVNCSTITLQRTDSYFKLFSFKIYHPGDHMLTQHNWYDYLYFVNDVFMPNGIEFTHSEFDTKVVVNVVMGSTIIEFRIREELLIVTVTPEHVHKDDAEFILEKSPIYVFDHQLSDEITHFKTTLDRRRAYLNPIIDGKPALDEPRYYVELVEDIPPDIIWSIYTAGGFSIIAGHDKSVGTDDPYRLALKTIDDFQYVVSNDGKVKGALRGKNGSPAKALVAVMKKIQDAYDRHHDHASTVGYLEEIQNNIEKSMHVENANLNLSIIKACVDASDYVDSARGE